MVQCQSPEVVYEALTEARESNRPRHRAGLSAEALVEDSLIGKYAVLTGLMASRTAGR